MYRKLVEHEQYKHLREVLAQRPKNYQIDSCPFIANALRWSSMADEIVVLKDNLAKLDLELSETAELRKTTEHRMDVHLEAKKLLSYLESLRELLHKYLHIDDLEKLYRAIGNGTWSELLSIMKLKDEVVILSEKQLYLQIVNQRLPEVEHAIEMAKVYGANRDLLNHQLSKLNDTRDLLRSEMQELEIHLTIGKRQKRRYE